MSSLSKPGTLGRRISDLMTFMKRRADEIHEQSNDDTRMPLDEVFVKALHQSTKEYINIDDFEDYTVINFIIMGAKEDYTAIELRAFLMSLEDDA